MSRREITVVIRGGVCEDVIGVDSYTVIDYDDLREQGKFTSEIDEMVDKAQQKASE